MTARHLLLYTLFSGFMHTAPAAGAVVIPDDVIVHVYDLSRAEAAVTNRALAVAGRTLDGVGIGVEWRRCVGTASSCTAATRGRSFVLRIVDDAPASDGGAAALRSSRGLALGDAFVDTATGSGVLATIYIARVRLLAAAAHSDVGTLLGRAIAHELGHLLLGSNRHATRGLMRAVWSADDLRRERASDWTFAHDDAVAMRRRVDAAKALRE